MPKLFLRRIPIDFRNASLRQDYSPGQVFGLPHLPRTTTITLAVSSRSIGDVAEDEYTADFDEDGIFPEPIYKHVEDPYHHTVYQAQFTKVRSYYIVRPILKIIEKYYYQL